MAYYSNLNLGDDINEDFSDINIVDGLDACAGRFLYKIKSIEDKYNRKIYEKSSITTISQYHDIDDIDDIEDEMDGESSSSSSSEVDDSELIDFNDRFRPVSSVDRDDVFQDEECQTIPRETSDQRKRKASDCVEVVSGDFVQRNDECEPMPKYRKTSLSMVPYRSQNNRMTYNTISVSGSVSCLRFPTCAVKVHISNADNSVWQCMLEATLKKYENIFLPIINRSSTRQTQPLDRFVRTDLIFSSNWNFTKVGDMKRERDKISFNGNKSQEFHDSQSRIPGSNTSNDKSNRDECTLPPPSSGLVTPTVSVLRDGNCLSTRRSFCVSTITSHRGSALMCTAIESQPRNIHTAGELTYCEPPFDVSTRMPLTGNLVEDGKDGSGLGPPASSPSRKRTHVRHTSPRKNSGDDTLPCDGSSSPSRLRTYVNKMSPLKSSEADIRGPSRIRISSAGSSRTSRQLTYVSDFSPCEESNRLARQRTYVSELSPSKERNTLARQRTYVSDLSPSKESNTPARQRTYVSDFSPSKESNTPARQRTYVSDLSPSKESNTPARQRTYVSDFSLSKESNTLARQCTYVSNISPHENSVTPSRQRTFVRNTSPCEERSAALRQRVFVNHILPCKGSITVRNTSLNGDSSTLSSRRTHVSNISPQVGGSTPSRQCSYSSNMSPCGDSNKPFRQGTDAKNRSPNVDSNTPSRQRTYIRDISPNGDSSTPSRQCTYVRNISSHGDNSTPSKQSTNVSNNSPNGDGSTVYRQSSSTSSRQCRNGSNIPPNEGITISRQCPYVNISPNGDSNMPSKQRTYVSNYSPHGDSSTPSRQRKYISNNSPNGDGSTISRKCTYVNISPNGGSSTPSKQRTYVSKNSSQGNSGIPTRQRTYISANGDGSILSRQCTYVRNMSPNWDNSVASRQRLYSSNTSPNGDTSTPPRQGMDVRNMSPRTETRTLSRQHTNVRIKSPQAENSTPFIQRTYVSNMSPGEPCSTPSRQCTYLRNTSPCVNSSSPSQQNTYRRNMSPRRASTPSTQRAHLRDKSPCESSGDSDDDMSPDRDSPSPSGDAAKLSPALSPVQERMHRAVKVRSDNGISPPRNNDLESRTAYGGFSAVQHEDVSPALSPVQERMHRAVKVRSDNGISPPRNNGLESRTVYGEFSAVQHEDVFSRSNIQSMSTPRTNTRLQSGSEISHRNRRVHNQVITEDILGRLSKSCRKNVSYRKEKSDESIADETIACQNNGSRSTRSKCKENSHESHSSASDFSDSMSPPDRNTEVPDDTSRYSRPHPGNMFKGQEVHQNGVCGDIPQRQNSCQSYSQMNVASYSQNAVTEDVSLKQSGPQTRFMLTQNQVRGKNHSGMSPGYISPVRQNYESHLADSRHNGLKEVTRHCHALTPASASSNHRNERRDDLSRFSGDISPHSPPDSHKDSDQIVGGSHAMNYRSPSGDQLSVSKSTRSQPNKYDGVFKRNLTPSSDGGNESTSTPSSQSSVRIHKSNKPVRNSFRVSSYISPPESDSVLTTPLNYNKRNQIQSSGPINLGDETYLSPSRHTKPQQSNNRSPAHQRMSATPHSREFPSDPSYTTKTVSSTNYSSECKNTSSPKAAIFFPCADHRNRTAWTSSSNNYNLRRLSPLVKPGPVTPNKRRQPHIY